MLCVLLPVALAIQVPDFRSEERVYISPPGAIPSSQLFAVVDDTGHRVFVLVFDEVKDGRIEQPWASETEEALEEVWSTWARADGFDASEDVVIVLGLDDREVRARAGSRWDADLGLHTEAMGLLIDEHFMPKAAVTDLDGALAALAVGVDAEIDQRLLWRTWQSRLPWMPLPLAAVGGAAVWGRRRRRARTAFEAEARAWLERLDRAEETLASFTMDVELRNRLIELRRDGPETDAACRRLAELIEEVRAGLAAQRRRVEAVQAGARAEGWESALAALSAPLEIDTGAHRLFDDPARKLHIEPQTLLAELESRYQEARALWSQLEEAVEMSLQPIQDLISDERLAAVTAKLQEEGLGGAWLTPHPLHPDLEEGLAELAKIQQDPYHFVAMREALLEAEEAYLEDVETLLSLLHTHRAHQVTPQPLPDLREPEVERLSALQAQAIALDERVRQMLLEPVSVDAFSAAVRESVTVASQITMLHNLFDGADEKATEAVRLADGYLEAVQAQHKTAAVKLDELRETLSAGEVAVLQKEVDEAHEDIEQMKSALAAAKRQQQEQQPLACLRAMASVQQERREALEDIDQFGDALDAMMEARRSAAALAKTLDETRARHVARLQTSGLPQTSMQRGDHTRSALEAQTDLDGAEQHRLIKRVLSAWKTDSSRAIRASTGADQADAESDEALLREMRRAEVFSFLTFGIGDFAKDLNKMATSPANSGNFSESSSSSVPHRSRHGSSLGSGFAHAQSRKQKRSSSFGSSSGRSAGRSIGGSGRRSGGRSFGSSSGGRSGGRKF